MSEREWRAALERKDARIEELEEALRRLLDLNEPFASNDVELSDEVEARIRATLGENQS